MSKNRFPRSTAAGWERYLALGVVVIFGAALLVIFAAGALLLPEATTLKTITLVVNGQPETVETRAQTIADLLAEQDLILLDGDSVSPGLTSRVTRNLIVRVAQARSVTLTIDQQSQIYRTQLTNPADILASAGIHVGSRDVVLVDGTRAQPDRLVDWPVPVTRIQVRRMLTINVVDDYQARQIETTSSTVGEALFDAGITLYLADRVEPAVDTPVTAGMTIRIERGRPLAIVADGTIVETRVRGITVADALSEAGLVLVGQDYAIPDESTPLMPGMRVRIIRVKEEFLTEESSQPYETIFQADAALEIDQRQLVQSGQNGITRTTIRVRYENGVEVSREAVETTVVQEARSEVVAYGTNIVLRTIDTPDGPRQYWRRIRMYATSYHPAALGGDTRTAIGETLRKGIVASDPDIIPYRSEVYVPGYGVGLMADTGPAHRPLFIDLGYSDDDFVSWSRWVDVYLLAPAPADIRYLLPSE